MLDASRCATKKQAGVAFDTKATIDGVNKRTFESIGYTVRA